MSMEQAQAIWAAIPAIIQQALIGLVLSVIAWFTQEVRKRTAVREQAVIGAVAEIEAASNPRVIMSSASKKSAAIAHALERMPAKARAICCVPISEIAAIDAEPRTLEVMKLRTPAPTLAQVPDTGVLSVPRIEPHTASSRSE